MKEFDFEKDHHHGIFQIQCLLFLKRTFEKAKYWRKKKKKNLD